MLKVLSQSPRLAPEPAPAPRWRKPAGGPRQFMSPCGLEIVHIPELQRLTRVDFDNLNYEVTVDDPGAYTAPWTSGFTLGFTKGAELFEYQCQENNLSPESMVGGALSSAIVP